MTPQIAIVDPFVKTQAIQCFNNLVNLLRLPATYHMPSQIGCETLLKERSKTNAYIVLGSASHVHENLPWHKPLADFLIEELKAGKPVLGCCFGHQIVCHALGSKVEFHSNDEQKLSGARKVKITQDFWNYKQDEEFIMGVTHKQVVRALAPGLRAVGHGLENDIVIHESLPFMGTQAHPEASHFFCTDDIKDLSPNEIALVQDGGSRLIRRFFEHFKFI